MAAFLEAGLTVYEAQSFSRQVRSANPAQSKLRGRAGQFPKEV